MAHLAQRLTTGLIVAPFYRSVRLIVPVNPATGSPLRAITRRLPGGKNGDDGDGGPASAAKINEPRGIALTPGGLGVIELALIGGLSAAGGDREAVTAAVLDVCFPAEKGSDRKDRFVANQEPFFVARVRPVPLGSPATGVMDRLFARRSSATPRGPEEN